MRFEIMPNLWQVAGGDLTAPGDAAAYLIRFGEGAALIDAGCGEGHYGVFRGKKRCAILSSPSYPPDNFYPCEKITDSM